MFRAAVHAGYSQADIFTYLCRNYVPLSWWCRQIISQLLAIRRHGWHNVTKRPVLPVKVKPLQQVYTQPITWHDIWRRLPFQLGNKHVSEKYYSTQCKPATILRMDADTTDLLIHTQHANLINNYSTNIFQMCAVIKWYLYTKLSSCS